MMGGRAHDSPPKPRPVMTLAGALWQEFTTLHGERRPAATGDEPDAGLQAYYEAALDKNQAALCLSGGGIRSAAFSLGVLQALARKQLLTSFHYLSTVSGGGYIGGWLDAMLHVHGNDAVSVQKTLAGIEAPRELRELRAFTEFLTPAPGVASADSWAAVLLWLRNVLVNWMIFAPALFALALLPGLYADLLGVISPGWSWVLLIAALLALLVGSYNTAANLPSVNFPSAASVPRLMIWPLLLWALLVPLAAAPWLHTVMPSCAVPGDAIPLLAFLVVELAYLVVAACATGGKRTLLWRNFGWWTLAALAAAAALWLALGFGIGRDPVIVAVLGPLAVTLAYLVKTLLYVALRKQAYRGELDREWLARLSAVNVVPALLWAVFAAVCLLLPRLVLDGWSSIVEPALVSAFAFLAGPVAALIAMFSKDEPDVGGDEPVGGRYALFLKIGLVLLAGIFAALLFMLLARFGAALSGHRALFGALLLALAAALAWWLGQRINVNRFSMHAVYRNRVVRAFLGTPRKKREPDRFTDFDPSDNLRMVDVAAKVEGQRRLFHVINVTLNLVAGSNNAWTERKGESFTITSCACGAGFLRRREDDTADIAARGAYVETAQYAGNEKETGPDDCGRGITLGTAMTISGAAVSPSMGYASSPAAAFLMTLFNVRLGAWLPNPAVATTEQLLQAKPPNALKTLARELLGLTDDRDDAVYLTDGGHFEDLGLYEMVRRRCRYIVVVDAGEDGHAAFEDLGNAVRKIRIDFNVEIKFKPPVVIGSRAKPIDPFRCFAYGTIKYPEDSGEKKVGQLLYLKPAFPSDAPIDVRAYGNLHRTFPHETTLDQFFTESQFESYRKLALFETELAPEPAPGPDAMGQFFDSVEGFLRSLEKEPAAD